MRIRQLCYICLQRVYALCIRLQPSNRLSLSYQQGSFFSPAATEKDASQPGAHLFADFFTIRTIPHFNHAAPSHLTILSSKNSSFVYNNTPVEVAIALQPQAVNDYYTAAGLGLPVIHQKTMLI